jgi:hypothetical protein
VPAQWITAFSVWPEAQVACSHSRICATLMTGAGTALVGTGAAARATCEFVFYPPTSARASAARAVLR